MENLNVIEILKVGLPGLVFLLSVLSFKLLTREQLKNSPSLIMLKSIKHFMYINIFLAVLTAGAPFIEKNYRDLIIVANSSDEDKPLTIPIVRNDELGTKQVRYCLNAHYAERFLLIADSNSNLIQARANLPIPCNGKEELQIGASIGFDFEHEATVYVARSGMKFIMANEGDKI